MSQQVQSKGGWIASFIIVGAVLVLGLLAALYYVKTRQIEDTSQPVAVESEKTDDTDKASEKPTTDDKGNETDAKDKEKQPTDTSADEEAAGSADADESDSSSDSSSDELPATGPGDVAAQMMGLVALTASGAAYVQSRRSL